MFAKVLELLKLTFRIPKPFEPAEAEAAFLRDYGLRFLIHRRAATVLAIGYWAGFVEWDFYHAFRNEAFRDVLPYVLFFRSCGTSVIIVFAWFSFKPYFSNESTATVVLTVAGVISYALLTAMIVVVPFPLNYMYYSPGLLLVVVFVYGLLRLRARPAIRLGLVCIMISLFAYPFAHNAVPGSTEIGFSWYYYSTSMFYVITFVVVGFAIAIELERTARDAFFRETQLALKNGELQSLNVALEETKRETEFKSAALVAMKEQAQLRAERENMEKSKFLADAAHDLRQPMQALTNLIEAATHAITRSDQEKSRELLENAEMALRTARASFNAILDISRLESGFVKAEYSAFDIDGLLESVLPPLRIAALERKVRLRMRLSGKNATVRSDPHLLGRVLTNLISNAIKYSDPGKSERAFVFVGVVSLPTRVRVDIVDNGIGIPERHWENIFKPFFQLGNAARDREKGLGLGLSIVKAIMLLLEQHRIEMRSVENRGTRFSLELPAAARATSIHDHADSRATITSDLSGLYVIYVEDDVLVRASTVALLQEYRILHEAVGSFRELEARLGLIERVPDIVITDYRLPDGRTAQDVMRLIGEVFDFEVPVIVVSGEVIIASNQEFTPAALLTKPVSPDTLFAAILRIADQTSARSNLQTAQ